MRRTAADRLAWYGCLLTVGLVAIVVFALGLLEVLEQSRHIAMAMCAAAVTIAGAYFLAMRAPRKRLTHLPTPMADVQPGLVHTAGLVGFTEEPRLAPLGGPPCMFYRVIVEAAGNVVFEGRSADELSLGDGTTARVVVHLDGATWRWNRSHELESSPSTPNEEVVRYLTERGLPHDTSIKVRVEWIAPHELVFVHGAAKQRTTVVGARSEYRTAEVTELEMRAAPDEPLVLGLEPLA